MTWEQIKEFCDQHEVAVFRGEDWQYHCHIDNMTWAIGMTFYEALRDGMVSYSIHNSKFEV